MTSRNSLASACAQLMFSLIIGSQGSCERGTGGERAQAPAPTKTANVPDKPPELNEQSQPHRPEDGAALYQRMCSVCHGEHGEGYRADEAPALAQPDFLASVSDDYLALAIAQGRQGTSMSAWLVDRGGPLSRADISALIALLRSWQKKPTATLDETPVSGDAQHGQRLFFVHCQPCHGGNKPRYERILEPAILSSASDGFLRHAMRTGRPPTAMPSYSASLGQKGIEDVLAYVRTFSAKAVERSKAPAPPMPLGKVLLHARGPEPKSFKTFPERTSVDVVHDALLHNARFGLLDARAPTDYAELHIAGAVSVPFYDPSPYLASLPKDAWLVAYCACPHAESGALAEKLQAAGFSKVTILDEGLNVWAERKYPVQAGLSQ